MHTCTIVVPQVFEYNLVLFDRKNINFIWFTRTKFALKKIDYVWKALVKMLCNRKNTLVHNSHSIHSFQNNTFQCFKIGCP